MNEEKLYCKHCNKYVKDKDQCIDHLEAITKLEENFSKSTNINIPAEKIPALPNKNAKEKSEDSSSEEEDVYTCDICDKKCTCFLSFQLHLNGKKHQRNLTKAKLLKEMKENNSIPDTSEEKPPDEQSLLDKVFTKPQYASSDIKCDICQIKCCGPKAFKQHTEGASHQKKLAKQRLMQERKSEGISEGDDNSFFGCDACQKTFTGPLPYQQHMESPTHQKRVQHLAALSGIDDQIITDEEDSRNIKCKECKKVFSGPVPFNAHLKSHEKLKKKSAQMEDLEKKHPEMLRIPYEKDDNVANARFLACEMCHLVFNGPVSAKDHFASAKHQKKAEKKKQFQKYMKQQTGKLQTVKLPQEPSNKSSDEENFVMIAKV